jgi:hypothetical protein
MAGDCAVVGRGARLVSGLSLAIHISPNNGAINVIQVDKLVSLCWQCIEHFESLRSDQYW